MTRKWKSFATAMVQLVAGVGGAMAAMPQALVEQLVDLTTRRLAAVLADRPTHHGEESEFGVDGLEIADARRRY
jgi:hypothetical protein